MALRIGFDLDGVFADMESELVRQSETLFGEPMTRRLQERAAEAGDGAAGAPSGRDAGRAGGAPPEFAPPVAQLNMTSRQQRRLWHHVESIENFWEGLEELEPGVIQRLATLATDRRWEIIFLTKRPETAGATAQVQSQRWLESKGFTLPSVFVVQGSRGRIAAALGLDIVVDDRPENCLDVVVDSKARAILVWRGDESQLPPAAQRLGIGVVKSVADCLDDPHADRRGGARGAGRDEPGDAAARAQGAGRALAESFEPLQFFDQRRALEIEQPRRLSLVAAGPLQRSLNQLALDVGDERVEIHAVFGQRDRGRIDARSCACCTSVGRSPTSICDRPAVNATARSMAFSS